MKPTAIELDWADGGYIFDIGPLDRVRALQEKCDAGPQLIAHRLESGFWKVDDFRETLLQGLIGGGKTAAEALALIRQYVDGIPAKEHILPARAVLLAYINGLPKGKAEKKTKRRRSKTKTSESASSPLTESTATAP